LRIFLTLLFFNIFIFTDEVVTYESTLWNVNTIFSDKHSNSYCNIEKTSNKVIDKKTGIISTREGAVKIYPYQKSENELIYVIEIFDSKFLNFVTSDNSVRKYFYPDLNPEIYLFGYDWYEKDLENAVFLIKKNIEYRIWGVTMYLYIPSSLVYEYQKQLKGFKDGELQEVLIIDADTSYFSEDYNRVINIQNFRNWITHLSACHQDKVVYANELRRLNNIKEIERQKAEKIEEERKLIEEEKQRQALFSKINELNKKCVESGGVWNKNNKEIKEVFDFTSMLYCEIPRRYRYARSSESDDYEEDEEELNDAMFDEGTPQCDEGTWYEENGYC